MKQKRVLWYLVGVIGIAALAMIVVATQPVANATAALAGYQKFDAKALSFDLKCNIKVPGGLAQCGSQASSCKNCHEVKGEDAVNAKGDWHVSHAFGDFCEFCHGGNVQATDKDAAHQGLVKPLGDVKANCSSCHASDYQAKAETYATALGVKVGGSGGAQPPAPQPPAQPQQPASQPPAQTVPQTAPKPAASTTKSSGEIVDYARPAGISAGNVIVGGLLVITVVAGGGFVYWNEKRLRRLAAPQAAAASRIVAQPTEVPVTSIDQLLPDAIKLLPVLEEVDPRTLRALRVILADRKRGEELLQSLSLINFTVLEEMKRLDKKELSLLLALAAES